ncbi:hypothetical protein EJ07DRAFT_179125 [Lizonia empirigonia]|nr:hypothetical protein EJ07DRAFT_179125 [Lizonia empirigonia]
MDTQALQLVKPYAGIDQLQESAVEAEHSEESKSQKEADFERAYEHVLKLREDAPLCLPKTLVSEPRKRGTKDRDSELTAIDLRGARVNKRQRTENSEDNQSQCDGTAGSNVSMDVVIRSQPEKHNMNDRLTMLPGQQVSGAGAASATISSVDADDHDSHAPQPSRQDGLEHSHSSTIPSPKSQGVMNSSATVSVGGCGDGFTLPDEQAITLNEPTAEVFSTTHVERSSTRANSARPTSGWQDTILGVNDNPQSSYEDHHDATHSVDDVPSLYVKDVRIGDQTIGELDLFVTY